MPDCSKQQERLNELKGELEGLQSQLVGASPQQKAGIGAQISVVRKKIEIADADLKQCLNQGVRGAIFPEYYVVALLYSPPGIGSETVYGNGSTAGTTTETSHSFKEGLNVTTSGGFFGNGIDVSVAFAGGSKNGTSFEVKKAKSSSLSLQSQLDEVDHSRDVFFIWTNVQIDVAQQLDSGLFLNLRSKDDGNAMEIVPLTVAELRDPSLIPDHKKSKLANFTQQHYSKILALNPLAQNQKPDQRRFRRLQLLQLDGPDHPKDSIPGQGIAISDERAAGLISGVTTQLTVGLTMQTGVNFFGVLNANVGVGGTFEWDYESTTNVSAGTKEEATVTLRTGTVGYHAVIEVYQDTIFKTLAFVSKTKKIPGESAVIFGTVTNLHRIPIFNERVDVIQGNGDSRTVFTNAQGIYRLFSIPEGDVHITVAGVTKVVTLHSNQKVELSFQVSKELSY